MILKNLSNHFGLLNLSLKVKYLDLYLPFKSIKLLDSVVCETFYIESVINKCRLDLAITQGKIREADFIVKNTNALAGKERSDDCMYFKYLTSIDLIDSLNNKNYTDKIEELIEKYPNDHVLNHDAGNYYSWKNDSIKAEKHYKIALSESNNSDSVRFDYGRFLMSIGKIREGISYYSNRDVFPNFKTGLKLPAQKRLNINILDDELKKGKIILVSEQGLGDQIRLLYLVAAIASREKVKIIYYTGDRFVKFINIDNVIIKEYKDYLADGEPSAFYALDCVVLLENDKDYILSEKIEIKTPEVNLALGTKNNVGVIFTTLMRGEFNDSMDIMSPRINEIETVLKILQPANVYSMQYEFQNIKIKYKFKYEVKYSKDIDYFNDWQSVLSIAKQCKAIVGPDSSQTLLAAMSGAPTIMITPVKDPLYFGRSDRDSFMKNVNFIPINKIRK